MKRLVERKNFVYGIRAFYERLYFLIRQPIFIALTLFGNLLVSAGSISLYILEKDSNPNINSLLDTVWWAISTVTTVGYGDITPISAGGKIIGIIMMIMGTALFWSFTALFADALLSDQLVDVEQTLNDIENILVKLDTREESEALELARLFTKLRTSRNRKINRA